MKKVYFYTLILINTLITIYLLKISIEWLFKPNYNIGLFGIILLFHILFFQSLISIPYVFLCYINKNISSREFIKKLALVYYCQFHFYVFFAAAPLAEKYISLIDVKYTEYKKCNIADCYAPNEETAKGC